MLMVTAVLLVRVTGWGRGLGAYGLAGEGEVAGAKGEALGGVDCLEEKDVRCGEVGVAGVDGDDGVDAGGGGWR